MGSDLPQSSSSSCCDIQGLNELYNDLVTALSATFDTSANKDTAESAKRLGAVREQFYTKCNELIQDLVVLQKKISSGQVNSVQQQHRQQGVSSAAQAGGAAQADKMEIDGQQVQSQPEQEGLLATQQQSVQAVAAMVQQHHSFVQQLQNAASSAGNGSVG